MRNLILLTIFSFTIVASDFFMLKHPVNQINLNSLNFSRENSKGETLIEAVKGDLKYCILLFDKPIDCSIDDIKQIISNFKHLIGNNTMKDFMIWFYNTNNLNVDNLLEQRDKNFPQIFDYYSTFSWHTNGFINSNVSLLNVKFNIMFQFKFDSENTRNLMIYIFKQNKTIELDNLEDNDHICNISLFLQQDEIQWRFTPKSTKYMSFQNDNNVIKRIEDFSNNQDLKKQLTNRIIINQDTFMDIESNFMENDLISFEK